jgi:hypothetical protein
MLAIIMKITSPSKPMPARKIARLISTEDAFAAAIAPAKPQTIEVQNKNAAISKTPYKKL